MKRSPARREQDRADLMAALADAERPITAPALVAAAYGYTIATIPDRVLDVAWHRAFTDLRALQRAGKLAMDTNGFLATYTRVDLPGSELADRQARRREEWDDDTEVRRMLATWEPAD